MLLFLNKPSYDCDIATMVGDKETWFSRFHSAEDNFLSIIFEKSIFNLYYYDSISIIHS